MTVRARDDWLSLAPVLPPDCSEYPKYHYHLP
jgi:hypothetical protein